MDTSPRPLEGRTAVVTGAGRGIGRAIAAAIASDGARVVLVGRRASGLDETRQRIEAAGGCAEPLVADIREPSWLEQLDAVAPTLDVVVCNAAAYAPFVVVEDGDGDADELVHATVVTATLRLIRHALTGMKERGFGRIICTGSLAGELGGAGQVSYATAKASLLGLVRTVAVEAARFGVTANIVQPGLVDTERVAEAISPSVRDRILQSVPAGRIGTAEEIADAVAFLASPRAGYITGAVLPVSGGLGLGLYTAGP